MKPRGTDFDAVRCDPSSHEPQALRRNGGRNPGVAGATEAKGGASFADSPLRKRGIVIIDEAPMVRDWLAGLIGSQVDIGVLAQCPSLTEGQKIVAASAVDVVIVDSALRDSRGDGAVTLLRRARRDLKILVFSRLIGEAEAERAFLDGARGFLDHWRTGPEVLAAIREILSSGIHLHEGVAKKILTTMADGSKVSRGLSPDAVLSTRELQVFEHVGTGYGPKEIAAMMNVSVSTVENYTSRIKAKLRLMTARELHLQSVAWMRARAR